MLVTRLSAWSHLEHTREVDITPEALAAIEAGLSVLVAAAHLPPEEREYLMTGVTPEEWKAEFGARRTAAWTPPGEAS